MTAARRIAAFYISLEPGPGRLPIFSCGDTTTYIRIQLLPGGITLGHSMSLVEPQEGESLMNTHYVEEELG